LCEPGEALATASAVAARIAANAPLAVRTSKQLVDDSVDWSQSEWFDLQKPYTRLVRQSRDAVEGATAFAEGRRPEWQRR
jgi:enoyl-CoA hydratase